MSLKSAKSLPDYYHEWTEDDSRSIRSILEKSGPVKEMSLDEIRNLLDSRMGDKTLSSVVREIRDEGY